MLVATVSTQRSGTKMLGHCFLNGTEVSPFGEIFNSDVPHIASFQDFMFAQGTSLIPRGSDAVLDAYFAKFDTIRNISAFDIMFNQIEIPAVSWNVHSGFFFYGYLKSRGAVVVDLRRCPFETFVSMKSLEVHGGPAHTFGNSVIEAEPFTPAMLDEAEFLVYRRNLAWHREALDMAMDGYDRCFMLDYSTLAKTQRVPFALCELIARAALPDVKADPENVQIKLPTIRQSNTDYSLKFSNFDELNAKYGG